MSSMSLRHYCGELIYAEVYQSHGETIPAFFGKNDPSMVICDCPGCGEELDLDFCGSPWLVDPMNDVLAQNTAITKYCSNCWGNEFDLTQAHDIDGNFIGVRVVCKRCREETVGYVSMNHITTQKSDDYIYWRSDIVAISNALGLEPPKFRSEQENVKELGF